MNQIVVIIITMVTIITISTRAKFYIKWQRAVIIFNKTPFDGNTFGGTTLRVASEKDSPQKVETKSNSV